MTSRKKSVGSGEDRHQKIERNLSLPPNLAGYPAREQTFSATNRSIPVADFQRSHQRFSGFIGTSPVMLALYDQILNAAGSLAIAFITGESGTGKNICAQAIHHYSRRFREPFIHISSTSPHDLFGTEGALKRARGGTLFLDGVCEMPDDTQGKLLDFLLEEQQRRFLDSPYETAAARIVCATHRDPLAEISAGRFREDLFYRLHVIPIEMPPLRHRGADVIDIAQILLLNYAAEEGKNFKGFTTDAERLLRQYPWPGNIRQLQNTIHHAVVMHNGITITRAMLSGLHMMPVKARMTAQPVWQKPPDETLLVQPLQDVERIAIERAIRLCDGNILQAAALLQISPSTIYRKKTGWNGPGDLPSDPEPYRQ